MNITENTLLCLKEGNISKKQPNYKPAITFLALPVGKYATNIHRPQIIIGNFFLYFLKCKIEYAVEKYIIDINNLSITMDNDVFMETATSDVDLEKRLLIPTVTILYPHIKEALKIKIQILSCNISSLILRERLLLPPQNLEPANKENVHNNKQILKVNICESLNAYEIQG